MMNIKHHDTGLKVFFNPNTPGLLKHTPHPPQTDSKLTIKVNNKHIPYHFAPATIPEFKTFQLIPHTDLKNEKVHQFADIISDSYQEMFQRFKNKKLVDQDKVFFETIMTNRSYQTFVTTQTDLADMVKQQSQLIWKNVTVKDQNKPIYKLSPNALGYDIQLKYPFFLSLKTDKKMTVTPLNELLEISQFMKDGDKVIIQFGIQAAEDGWFKDAAEQQENFEKKPPKRWRNDGFRDSTIMKSTHPGFNFSLRIYVYSNNERRKHRIARGIILSLKQLNYDNELRERMIKPGKMKKWISDFMSYKIKTPMLFGKRHIITPPEIGHFIKLPQNQLQLEFPIIDTISSKETKIPETITKGGFELGEAKYRGKPINTYMPIKNWDELCLPRVVIGGMGSGKTKGFGSNWIVSAVNQGFGALAIDPAKGEIGDQVAYALPPNKVKRIRLGKKLMSLDWCEVLHSERAKNRLANTIIGFFNTNGDETGGQTTRYIRAAVMAMQTGKLSEIMKILEDKDYRDILLCPKHGIRHELNSMHIATLEDLNKMSDGKRAQILAPIYNRLDTILGDSYLSDCMESDESIDMVEIMSQKKAFIFDVPKSELGPEAVDLIVNLLSTKIDLAMTLREEANQFPFFVLFDEPHQFLKSAKTWKAATVESRKWRVGYVWMFHSWEQIPKDLAEIIKAAGPHYHIYPSSKKTFTDLKEEIEPFTVGNGLGLKRFHAINILRTGNGVAKPFIAKMAAPPSESKKFKEIYIKVS